MVLEDCRKEIGRLYKENRDLRRQLKDVREVIEKLRAIVDQGIESMQEAAAVLEAGNITICIGGLEQVSEEMRAAAEAPGKPTIRETLDAIHKAGGKAWDKIEDPEAYLRELRGEEPDKTEQKGKRDAGSNT
ncbi:hypothetical protein LCGC14_1834820 [marine sediment metagenome]|uniref:Uncharacterized protein n=1 Tax=marine sediment metagenome TaxID=412755 RepID=A0A0F9JEJ0_9ZZZZ